MRSLDRDNVTVTLNILNMFFVDISEIGDVYYINRGVDSIQSISMRQYEVRRVSVKFKSKFCFVQERKN